MALGESLIERAERTPRGYAAKVRWLATIYMALPIVSAAMVGVLAWRIRLLVTLTQRSNVETLVLAIAAVLALYYLVSTARGFVGGVRIVWHSAPLLWGRQRARVERRKQAALADGGEVISVCFDHVLRRRGEPEGAIAWTVGDADGSLGTLNVRGPTAWFQPRKAGINNSLFVYLSDRLNARVTTSDPADTLVIVLWDNIDPEAAAMFRSAVAALDRLGGGKTVWPEITLTESEIEAVGRDLQALVPTLRNEALLPDLEYEIEYAVPILPEPLAFVQLKRHERRADPVLTMGYALVIMCLLLALLLLVIAFPPWVPSR